MSLGPAVPGFSKPIEGWDCAASSAEEMQQVGELEKASLGDLTKALRSTGGDQREILRKFACSLPPDHPHPLEAHLA